jgi:hypothetical protein
VKRKSITRPEQKSATQLELTNGKAARTIIVSKERVRKSSRKLSLATEAVSITQTIVVMSQREEDVSTIGR